MQFPNEEALEYHFRVRGLEVNDKKYVIELLLQRIYRNFFSECCEKFLDVNAYPYTQERKGRHPYFSRFIFYQIEDEKKIRDWRVLPVLSLIALPLVLVVSTINYNKGIRTNVTLLRLVVYFIKFYEVQ